MNGFFSLFYGMVMDYVRKCFSHNIVATKTFYFENDIFTVICYAHFAIELFRFLMCVGEQKKKQCADVYTVKFKRDKKNSLGKFFYNFGECVVVFKIFNYSEIVI